MGFYGNITNTSNTTFLFDRIYPNRLFMDANANNDGIFIGRYVLVEYQEKAAYPVAYNRTLVNGSSNQYYFYSSINKEEISKIKYLGIAPNEPEHLPSIDDVNAIYKDGFYKGEILQYYEYSSEKKDWIFSGEFYKCVDGMNGYAIFEKTATPEMKSDYIQNFEIDENHYGQNSKGFKGYDSTVWTKVSTEQNGKLITKYVNIADLNSVVPTFDITADAPTMTPITPHFDADSTNVYYKLHAQPQWGFRIAKADTDKSDENTQWIREFYNPNDDTSTKKYASDVTDGIPDWGDDSTATLPAAIYFNEDGFKKQLINTDERQGEIKKHSTTVIENTIKVEPTGKSGIEYNVHNGINGPSSSVQIDTQELTINLPAIGNMMSDAWDIIHGPNRDNARTDENSSLQGRLDSFKALYDNQIPIKIQDGTLVGSKINNAIKYDSNWEGKPQDILNDKTNPNFERDDAWIKTEINTNDLKNGDKDSEIDNQLNNSGISIHHTFHATENSISSVDKNIENGNILTENTYKSDKILSNNLSNIGNRKDFIELYTPYVDAKGHVVGKNIETITLPYGFKTIATNGKNASITANSSQNLPDSIVADNTQDTLNINTGNKWIVINTDADNDNLTIFHDIANPVEIKKGTSLSSEARGENKTFDVPTYTFDNAGHHQKTTINTLTMPFGYGKITGDNGTTSATATFDTLEIKSNDDWIATKVLKGEKNDKDKVYITHTGPVTGTPVAVADVEPEFGDTFNITDWHYDDKGHKYASTNHTVKIPQGSYTTADGATSHTDIITSIGFTPSSGAITSTKATTDTLTLYNYSADSGNLDIKSTDTINTGLKKIQNHINGLDMSSTSTTEFITEITQIDGKVAVKRAKAGTLVLGTQSTDKTVSADDSLNSAINKLEARIIAEENNRKAAINTLYGDNIENIAETFDTIKEIADFLEQDDNGIQSGIEQIISNINANTDAIKTEETRATVAENTLTTNLNNEISRAQSAENTLTTNLNGEITRATSAEETLNARITNLVGDFSGTLGTAAGKNIEDFAPAGSYVLQSDYEAKISELENTIAALEARITALEPPQSDTPSGE